MSGPVLILLLLLLLLLLLQSLLPLLERLPRPEQELPPEQLGRLPKQLLLEVEAVPADKGLTR